MEAIDQWETFRVKDITEAHHAARQRPDIPQLAPIAASKGFRLATLSEILYLGPEDLFTWRGLCWVKQEPTAGEQLKLGI